MFPLTQVSPAQFSGALLIAVPLYFTDPLEVPDSVVLLFCLIILATFFNAVEKWVTPTEQFSLHKLFVGFWVRLMSLPMLLACHFADVGLQLNYNIEKYACYVFMGYTFLSLADSYIKFGGPGGEALRSLLDRIKVVLAAKQQEVSDQADILKAAVKAQGQVPNSPIMAPGIPPDQDPK